MTDTALAQTRTAARGMLHIVTQIRDAQTRRQLAYEAVYACRFDGRGKLELFKNSTHSANDLSLWMSIAREVRDRVKVEGWRVERVDGERVVLVREGVHAFVRRAAIRERLDADAPVSITLPAVHRPLGGFIRRHDPKWDATSARQMSRIYLNISPEQALWVLGALFRRMRIVTPLSAKVLAHRAAYRRCDAAVLYLPSERAERAIGVLLRSIASEKIRLGRSVPLFTRPVAPGVGFADEPSDLEIPGLSHGRWVSSLFVEASTRVRDVDAIVERVERAIRQCGRDPKRPWLRAGRDSEVFLA